MNKEQIETFIQDNKDSMIRELFSWVSHPSVSRPELCAREAPFGPECRDMLTFALERGKELGFEAIDHDGYCGDLFYGSDTDMEEFGFVCHLDVVPAGEGWICEPFQPVEKDGFLIGRGIDDNKGSAILILWAVRFFMENRIPLKKRIRIMLGCSEENGMLDFHHYSAMPGASYPPLTIVPDAPFPVCYAQKGGWNGTVRIPAGADIVSLQAGTARNSVPAEAVLVLKGPCVKKALELPLRHPEITAEIGSAPSELLSSEPSAFLSLLHSEASSPSEIISSNAYTDYTEYVILTAHGKSGHAAFPEGTCNALTMLCRVICEEGLDRLSDLRGLSLIADRFSSYYGEGMGLSFSDTASGPLTMNAGVASLTQRPTHDLLLEMDIRFPVSMNSEDITAAFQNTLVPSGAAVEQVSVSEPYYLDPEDPSVLTLMSIYREVTGRTQDSPYSMGGGTYSRVIPNAISFGPGLPGKPVPSFLPAGHGSPHGPDEALHIDTWLKCLEIYIRVIEAFCCE